MIARIRTANDPCQLQNSLDRPEMPGCSSPLFWSAPELEKTDSNRRGTLKRMLPSAIKVRAMTPRKTEHAEGASGRPEYERERGRVSFSRQALFPLLSFLCMLLAPAMALAAENIAMPSLQLSLSGGEASPEKVSLTLEILFLLTVLSLAPAIMLTVTSFTRIIIVFHFLRQAMGIQQIPPTQILASLAIFMTVVIMFPVGKQINDEALQPYLDERIGFTVALERAQAPLRTFMFKHTREKDLSVFYSIAKMEAPRTKEDVPTLMLAAAYVISELKTGFTIGFLIYIPFLILDMVISSILLAMGMMMLPPMMVSMPFKLLLFVMVDGWNLLVGSLVNSFLG